MKDNCFTYTPIFEDDKQVGVTITSNTTGTSLQVEHKFFGFEDFTPVVIVTGKVTNVTVDIPEGKLDLQEFLDVVDAYDKTGNVGC